MGVSIAGIVFIGAGLMLAMFFARFMVAALNVGGGWLLAHLAGYGTVYAVVVGLGLGGFVVVELGRRARHH